MEALTYVLAANRVTGMVGVQLRARGTWGCASTGIDDAAFLIVDQGTCWLRPRGHEPLQLVQGDIVVMPEGSPHVLASSRTGRATPFPQVLAEHPMSENGVVDLGGSGPAVNLIYGEFTFEHERAHPVLSLLPPLLHLPSSAATGAAELNSVVQLLAGELATPRPGSDTVVANLVDILFVHILRAWLATHNDAGPSWLRALRDPRIGTALAKLHAYPARPWTIESIAAEVNMSRAVFARRFTSLVGEAPMTYLTRWRMSLAARRLRDTDEPIARVAEQVGYISEYSFSRAFARTYSQAPGRYRHQSRPSTLAAVVVQGTRRPDEAHRQKSSEAMPAE